MKIRSVTFNNRKKGFEVRTSKAAFWFPYAKLEIRSTSDGPVVRAVVDAEIAREGFSYALASGKVGTVNQAPEYLRDRLLYRLTLEAQRRVARSRLSRREIIRRLGTSATQFYRLLDQTNYRKSIDQLLSLLHVLDCDVDLVVRAKSA